MTIIAFPLRAQRQLKLVPVKQIDKEQFRANRSGAFGRPAPSMAGTEYARQRVIEAIKVHRAAHGECDTVRLLNDISEEILEQARA